MGVTESTGPQLGVGAIVVHDGELLMVRRAHDPAKGLWSLPGGRVESGEYIADAIKREVKEETGLDVDVHDLVGIFEVMGDAKWKTHYVILDYAAVPVGDTEPRAAGDASEARWVPFDQIEKLECTPRFVETLTAWGVLSPSGS
jgi:mutator protein MutT